MPIARFFQLLKETILRRYTQWLDKRVPSRREVTLVQDNIFIYPNGQFIYYFIVVMVLWLAATNYENNLAFAFSFLLLAIFVVCIHHTYNNLAGLTLVAVGAEPVFADQYAEVELLLSSRKNRMRDALQLYWHKEQILHAALLDQSSLRIRVPVKAIRRGLFYPHRLTVDTVYPLGIIRAVSYLDMDIPILVYPKPVCHSSWQAGANGGGDGDVLVSSQGSEEFSHLQEYWSGASLKQVAWKQFARSGDLLIKQYGDYVSQQLWLDWEQFPSLALEERLSTLCYWALELDKRGEHYGLKIPGVLIEPGVGVLHREKVLTALALFGSLPA